MSLDANLDATGAEVRIPGRVNKPAGLPLRASVRLHRAGSRTDVTSATLEAPGIGIEAQGDSDAATHRIDIRAPVCRFDVAQFGRVAPIAVASLPPALASAHGSLSLALDGDPRALSSVQVHIRDLDAITGDGRYRGQLDIAGLTAPRSIHIDLVGDRFDLDALSRRGSPLAPAPHSDSGHARWFSTLHADGRIRLGSLRRAAFELSSIPT